MNNDIREIKETKKNKITMLDNDEYDNDDNDSVINNNDSNDEVLIYSTILKTLEKLKSFNNIIKIINDDIDENINKLTAIYNNIYYLKN